MLTFKRLGDTELRTLVRGVSRFGAFCCVSAMVVFIAGCPTVTPDACTGFDDDDGDDCTVDTCVVADDGTPSAVNTPLDCDDGDACTDDTCADGVCSNDAIAGCCADDADCAATETCIANACVTTCAGDAECDDSDACTSDSCVDSLCVNDAVTCTDDGDLCTTEACNSTTGLCESTAVVCGAGETCNAADGLCTSATICDTDADCPDNDTFCDGTESCNTTTNLCESSGDPCTGTDTCNEGLNQCDAIVILPTLFTLGTDNLVGTAGDDSFSGPLQFNAPTGTNVPSIQTGDTANGGDGADTLIGQFNFVVATTVAPTFTGIESLTFTDFGTAATTISGTSITGATSINMTGSTNTGPFIVNNLATLAGAGISSQASGLTLGFQSAASDGSSDAATISFNGLAPSSVAVCTGAGAPLVCCTGVGTGTCGTVTYTTGTTNGLETLTIDSTGSASTVPDIVMNGTTLTTVNVTGDADFTHTASLDANVTVINCSTASGDITLTQTNAGATNFTGGAGDDTIILGATYGTTDPINGGAGTDTLGGTTAVLGGTTVNQTNVTNIEVLRVSDAHTTVLDLAHFGTITGVTLDLGSNGGTIINANTGFSLACGFRAGAASVGAATLTTTISGSATTDSATFTMSDCEQATGVTFNGVETLNLVSNLDLDGSAANSGTAGQNTFTQILVLTDTAAPERIIITGTEQLNLTGAVTANEIDASGFTQPLIMGADCSLTGVTVTGGSAADTLRGSAGNDIINGGAGADIIDAGDGNDIISGGGGADTFQFVAGDLSAAPSATIFDTITDFAVGSDVIDDTAAALTIVTGVLNFGIATASISAEGICSFNAADDTLAERIIAAEDGIVENGAAAAGQYAIFEHGTNSYIFISDGTDAMQATDMLIQLTGVTGLSDSTLTAGNLTIK